MEVDLELNDDRFVLENPQPTLQSMASHSLARAIIYKIISLLPENSEADGVHPFQCKIEEKLLDEYDRLMGHVKLPAPIEELVKENLVHVRTELKTYHREFKCSVGSGLEKYTIKLFDPIYCVWLPNGKIDNRKTALKILSSAQLSQEQRFVMMAKFCLKDEMKTIRASSLSEDFVKSIRMPSQFGSRFDDSGLLFYWLCYLRNERNRVPLRNHRSVDMEMASTCNEWTSFLYFWNRLGASEQVTVAVELLTAKFPYGLFFYKKHILSMMSADQQHRLAAKIPEEMIQFAKYYTEDSSRFILWVWNHSKDTMTARKFSRVFMAVLRGHIHVEERMNALIEIWNSAPDHLKSRIIKKKTQKMLKHLLPGAKPEFSRYDRRGSSSSESDTVVPNDTPCPAAIRFLRLFLSQQNAIHRKRFLLNSLNKFGAHVGDPQPFDEIIKLCVPSIADQRRYKQLVVETHEMKRSCHELLMQKKFDALLSKLRFYLRSEISVQKYIKLLMEKQPAMSWVEFLYVKSSWDALSGFIDQVFADASQIKKTFVLSTASQLAGDTFEKYALSGLQEVVESVLSSQELVKFKQSFAKALAQSFRTQGYYYDGGQSCWSKPKLFIERAEWCCSGDENAIKQFQNRVCPVDLVFSAIFEYYGECFRRDSELQEGMFDLLNEYLEWYIPDNQQRKEYKMSKIDSSSDMYFIEMLIECGDESWDEPWDFLDTILDWCCDKDQQAIDGLKASHPKFKLPRGDGDA